MTKTDDPIDYDAVLVILAYAGHEGAMCEMNEANERRDMGKRVRLGIALDKLVERGLIEVEDGEYFPTPIAVQAAVECETLRLRSLAEQRKTFADRLVEQGEKAWRNQTR